MLIFQGVFLQLKLHPEAGMLFNAWLSEDEQVFKGMQDRKDGWKWKRSVGDKRSHT